MVQRIFLFGESERGPMRTPFFCRSIDELEERCGNAPEGSFGVDLAVHVLLCNKELVFFRVQEEGCCQEEYLYGLKSISAEFLPIMAIGIPGVGDYKIIEATASVCLTHNAIFILTDKDLYDYLAS